VQPTLSTPSGRPSPPPLPALPGRRARRRCSTRGMRHRCTTSSGFRGETVDGGKRGVEERHLDEADHGHSKDFSSCTVYCLAMYHSLKLLCRVESREKCCSQLFFSRFWLSLLLRPPLRFHSCREGVGCSIRRRGSTAPFRKLLFFRPPLNRSSRSLLPSSSLACRDGEVTEEARTGTAVLWVVQGTY
jgi:hypothetical protein